jgi:hypothetical protein
MEACNGPVPTHQSHVAGTFGWILDAFNVMLYSIIFANT